MEIGFAAFTALCALLAAPPRGQEQGARQEPPPDPVLVEPATTDPPRPLYPPDSGLTIRTIAVRPTFELTTREFDIGMFSGTFDFGEMADLDKTALAWDARVNAGRWILEATILHQESETRLDGEQVFEQFTYAAGAEVTCIAFYGSFEAFYGLPVIGGPTESFQLTFLMGLNFTKLYMMMREGDREGSEGFSALWPVPAAGLEARAWLSSRLAVSASARGTYISYSNPWQVDGGSSQDMHFRSGRFELGLEWALSESITVSGGYTGISSLIEAASAEDTDTGIMKTNGLHVGVGIGF